MKKTTLLNGPLSALIADLGHGDTICIGDAGLPVPEHVEKIDLALTRGVPSFFNTFDAVVSEMTVEAATLADELTESGSEFHQELQQRLQSLQSAQKNQIKQASVSHEHLKELTQQCKAVIRCGECTPYANIILTAGVSFQV